MGEGFGVSYIWIGIGIGAALLIMAATAAVTLAVNGRLKRKKAAQADKKEDVGMIPHTADVPADTPKAPAPISVSFGKLHEQGARSGQQDCFAVSDSSLIPTHGLLAVVADGMGGLADGDKASRAAVEAILDGFTLSQGIGTPEQLLLLLAEKANQAVNSLLGPGNYRKSGSTLVAGLIRGGMFSYISVGDSRICLYRGGQLIQLNREHIYRNELALQAINDETSFREVVSHPKAAGLTSFLGMGQLKYIDLPAQPIVLMPGDTFILMSDGVYNALSEQEISAALEHPAEAAADALRTAIQAKQYENQDNYTAVILSCTSMVPAASPASPGVTEMPAEKKVDEKKG